LILFVVLGALLSVLVSPLVGLPLAVVVGGTAWFATWRRATTSLLRAFHARPLDPREQPRVANVVDHLCATMGLPLPSLYVVADAPSNAVSLGRNPEEATLVVTSGLLQGFDPVQLEGVLAHELTHIKRRDTAPSTVAAALLLPFAGVFGGIGDLVHRIAGRGLEFEVDRAAVGVTRYPPGLRKGLAAMAEDVGHHPDGLLATSGGGRVTRWLWTVPLGAALGGDALIGELDAPAVRIAALDEH
jgi:Zn-dependent protease with chaperone function